MVIILSKALGMCSGAHTKQEPFLIYIFIAKWNKQLSLLTESSSHGMIKCFLRLHSKPDVVLKFQSIATPCLFLPPFLWNSISQATCASFSAEVDGNLPSSFHSPLLSHKTGR